MGQAQPSTKLQVLSGRKERKKVVKTQQSTSMLQEDLQGEFEVERVSPRLELINGHQEPATQKKALSSSGILENPGSFGWQIIQENQPTSEALSQFAHALPEKMTAKELKGWNRTPHTLQVKYLSDSPHGQNRTELSFLCRWHFGGATTTSAGYLKNVSITGEGKVAWGNTVTVSCSFDSPFHKFIGEKSVAALPFRIFLTEDNPSQHITKVVQGELSGDGSGTLSFRSL